MSDTYDRGLKKRAAMALKKTATASPCPVNSNDPVNKPIMPLFSAYKRDLFAMKAPNPLTGISAPAFANERKG